MDKPERILGGVGTRLLLENERVRIWEMDLAPGARSDTHRHDVDYVLVQLEGDRIAAMPEPDTAGTFRDYLEGDVVPGKVHYIRRGGIETAINAGQRRYREVLVELVEPVATAGRARRHRLVDEHVARENAHDLDGIMRTFDAPTTGFGLNGTVFDGAPAVRALYESLLLAFPDLSVAETARFES